jgi:hypothetical protein
MRALVTLLTAAAVAWGQNSLAPPQVGFMQDTAGVLRSVYGIAGNFLTGDPVAAGVISAAFSGSFGMAKTGSAVLAIDRQGQIIASVEVVEGPALFAFSRAGAPALAYVPAAKALFDWNEGTFRSVPFDDSLLGAGVVLSIAAPDSEHVAMIVQRDAGLREIRILLATGEIDSQQAVLGVAAPVLMLASGELVYGDVSGIVVRKADGSERHIVAQLPESFALAQMGEDWIQLADLGGGRQLAIRIAKDREQAYQLPERNQ